MKASATGVTLAASVGATFAGATASAPVTIHIEEVARFYRVYAAAGGRPDAEQLQHDYLDRGSEGLHKFARVRNISATAIASLHGAAAGRAPARAALARCAGAALSGDALSAADHSFSSARHVRERNALVLICYVARRNLTAREADDS